MKILVVGGGSGGHITPAVAVVREILAIRPRARIEFWTDFKYHKNVTKLTTEIGVAWGEEEKNKGGKIGVSNGFVNGVPIVKLITQGDITKKELKKASRKRIENGSNVKNELNYMDIVRKIEKAGDCVFGVIRAIQPTIESDLSNNDDIVKMVTTFVEGL